MFDPLLRRLIDPPLDPVGGMALCAWNIAQPVDAGWPRGRSGKQRHDGRSRSTGCSTAWTAASGGYLDIVCDMAFYAAVPLGLALASPANAVAANLLLASFLCSGARRIRACGERSRSFIRQA